MKALSRIAIFFVASLAVVSYSQASADQTIVNQASGGLVLDAHAFDVHRNDCRVQLWADVGWGNQRWNLVPVAGAPDCYKIVNVQSGLLLAAHLPDVDRNDCRIQLWEDLNLPNQQWRLIHLGGNVYKIQNRMSGLLLTAHLFDVRRNGCRLQLWEDLGFATQRWRFQ